MTAGAAALAIGLGATASLATTTSTWTVTPGGSWTGVKSGDFTLTDTTSNMAIVCVHTKAAGTLTSGTGLSGTGIGSISSIAISRCKGPGSAVFKVHGRNLPWSISANSYNPAITNGTTTGTLSGIHFVILGTGCTAVVDGTSASAKDGATEIHYHNSLAKLKIRTEASNLHLYNVVGCTGVFTGGDAVTISAAYKLTPTHTISSP
jgi:hypothetical protein